MVDYQIIYTVRNDKLQLKKKKKKETFEDTIVTKVFYYFYVWNRTEENAHCT